MSERDTRTVAIACQGGGSHTAFTAGVLREILESSPPEYTITSLSGTSGGAICATIVWDGLRRGEPDRALDRLESFWADIAASSPLERYSNTLSVWSSRLTEEFTTGTFNVSPYLNPFTSAFVREFRNTIDQHIQFEDPVPVAPPHLFIGSVNVESGSFVVFTDNENGSTPLKIRDDQTDETAPLQDGVKALLASAAIPQLFRAVEIEGVTGEREGHWDGQFSQNPPIRQFTMPDEVDDKPDEIWIVRLFPRETADIPTSLGDIVDRRTELSGNLSLQQEIHMIESINDLIAEGVIDDEAYKHIELKEIELGIDQDRHSKLNTDPSFLQMLMDRGTAAASDFWTTDGVRNESD